MVKPASWLFERHSTNPGTARAQALGFATTAGLFFNHLSTERKFNGGLV
jgi:hypothetical protein